MKRLQAGATALVSLLLLVLVTAIGYRLLNPDAGAAANLPGSATLAGPEFTPTPEISCLDAETSKYIADLDVLKVQWDDAVELAHSTARIALSSVVDTLQALRRDALALGPPACGVYLQELQAVFMRQEIDGFLAFMQQQDEEDVQSLLFTAFRSRSLFDTYLAEFRSDPLAAYTTAHQPSVLAEVHDELKDGWFNVRMIEGEPPIFSLPVGWTIPPADAYSKIKINNPAGNITLFVLTDKPADFLDNQSPPATLALAQEQLFAPSDNFQVSHYAKFGNNTGYMVTTVSSDGDKVDGVIRTPANLVYWFHLSKAGGMLTQAEENTIYAIIASIRQLN